MTAVIEVEDVGEEQKLILGDGVSLDLHWVHRAAVAPTDSGAGPLESALRGIELMASLDDLYVFAAGEAGAMKGVRRYLRREVGLPKDQLAVDGYWKRGVADHDHHTNDLDDD